MKSRHGSLGTTSKVKRRAGRGKRESLPATGGKDLGKRKGVAIDYLTGDGRGADFGS